MEVFLILITVILLNITIWSLWKWYNVKQYWAKHGVPFDPPHPLLGSLTFILKENPALWARKIYSKFKRPYVGIWLFWRPGLIINCPEMARRILVRDSDFFRDRYLSSGKSDPVGSLNLFTVKDPLWSILRRRLTVLFTSAKLRNLEGLVREKSNDLVERYKNEAINNPQNIDVRVINSDFSTDVIGEAAFGIRSLATKTGDSALRKITRDFMKFDVFRGVNWISIFFFPGLVDVFRNYNIQLQENASDSSGPLEVRIYTDGSKTASGTGSGTFSEDLNIHISTSLDIRENVLLAQAAIFLQAGFDTSGSTLTWTFKELSHAPHVQDKLYQELKKVTENLKIDVDANVLAQMPYLNAVIKETLRKYPPMGWLDRECSKDYKLDDKFTIPAGMPLYVNAAGMHMDPEFYPNPEVFDPERFMPENSINIKLYTYMPFGEGPRMCIGMRFAYMSMRFALAAVALSFIISAPPASPPPNKWPVENKGLFFAPKGQINLTFTPRN